MDRTDDHDIRVSLEYSGKQVSRGSGNNFIITKDFFLMASSHS
jgi:hypothetical protein